jgi:hypothetical protein
MQLRIAELEAALGKHVIMQEVRTSPGLHFLTAL